jgi:hypothetical protein
MLSGQRNTPRCGGASPSGVGRGAFTLARQRVACGIIALLSWQTGWATGFLVYNNDDTGPGTLRQAIAQNAVFGGGNTILFSNVATGTITLSSELLISNDVTIIGPGAKVLTLSGNNLTRVFNIAAGSVVIYNLTIAYGYPESFKKGGGGFFNQANLTLNSCVICSNSTAVSGGGISQEGGNLVVSGCTFAGNVTPTGSGAGIENAGGTVTVSLSTFAGNLATGGGGGAIIGGPLTVTDCTITGGSAEYGGGIYADGSVTVRNSIIAGNSATGTGPDCYGPFSSLGFNLIGAANGSTGFGALGDLVGSTNSPINPLLGPLQDNGGRIASA